jgi:uncharacterized membrane protein YfcA
VGIVGSLVLGALMTLGIGFYAPCMIMVSLLGMNSKDAFPIMMGACAFLMPIASARFVKEKKFNLKASVGLTLGGLPGVWLAAKVVTSLPLVWVRWLVVVVVAYTGISMLRTASRERAVAVGAGAVVPPA